ncbi:unnamed protein product [Clonostachys solani]|uniref:ribonuclease H n=1 Tax=Clonostachys solani TaxID=160281 RepID=A0A9P0ESG4_9HYPO|nr:unnamed protein product [Clonostachys solani]
MTNQDRVFILVGSTARFKPQNDEQVVGPANTQINTESNPVQIPLTYCATCGVTWLVGEIGLDAATKHPTHNTYEHIYAGTSRSLVVFIDGACPSNGPAALQASVGVYFGPDSPKNISRIIDTNNPTNQLAEITAALEAMRKVRSTVVLERRSLVKASFPGTGADKLRDLCHFRLILGTDSSYLVDCLCEYMPQWTSDDQNQVYGNRQGQTIKNSEGFRMLYEETELLSMVGVQVVWYYVPRDFNHEADALANAALPVA